MSLFSYFLAGAACLVLALGCSSGDDGFTDGNSDPQRAECETKAIFSCIRTSDQCHEWYSDEAADARRFGCSSTGGLALEEGCGESYPECCILEEGSSGYPEGVCFRANASNLAAIIDSCQSTTDDPRKWCGG